VTSITRSTTSQGAGGNRISATWFRRRCAETRRGELRLRSSGRRSTTPRARENGQLRKAFAGAAHYGEEIPSYTPGLKEPSLR